MAIQAPVPSLEGRSESRGLLVCPRAEIQKEVWLHMCLEHHALELGVSGIKKLVCGDQRLVPVQAKAKS